MRSYTKQACDILFLQYLLPGRVQLPVYSSLLHFPHLVFCDRSHILPSCCLYLPETHGTVDTRAPVI